MLALLGFMGVIAALDLLAVRYGVDSRRDERNL
jgi:hypothetical protein